ncbi:MAG: hypothetical protein GY803_20355 [Chloroflexi bacterium]|nr:hypothetical protein [Chloroflexota bacterium]
MNKRLQPFFDPNRSIPLFLLGTAVTSLILQVAYDYANNPGQWQGGYWVALIAIVTTVAAWLRLWRQRPGQVDIRKERQPRPRRGLILLAGPTVASNPAAITYHQNSLTHCWILSTHQSATTAADLFSQYGNQFDVQHGPNYTVDAEDLTSTYKVVMRILTQELRTSGLGSIDIIADMTGGAKPMTSGMVMACLAQRVPLQYIKAQRDDQGKVIYGAWGEPIRIDANFVPIPTGA